MGRIAWSHNYVFLCCYELRHPLVQIRLVLFFGCVCLFVLFCVAEVSVPSTFLVNLQCAVPSSFYYCLSGVPGGSRPEEFLSAERKQGPTAYGGSFQRQPFPPPKVLHHFLRYHQSQPLSVTPLCFVSQSQFGLLPWQVYIYVAKAYGYWTALLFVTTVPCLFVSCHFMGNVLVLTVHIVCLYTKQLL